MRQRSLAVLTAAGLVAAAAPASALPDLVVTSFSAQPWFKSPQRWDRTVRLTATVCNQGQDAAPSGWTLAFYKNSSSAPGCSTVADGGPQNNVLAAGQCLTQWYDWTQAPVGPYTAWARADSFCKVAESNEGNNNASFAGVVAPPDLYIKSLTYATHYDATYMMWVVNYTGEVCNQGSTAAIVGHASGYYFDQQSQPACGATPSGGSGVYNMPAPGGTIGNCQTVKFKREKLILGKTYTTWFVADIDCKTADGDRTNNYKSITFTLPVLDAGVPDAAVPDAGVPDAATDGPIFDLGPAPCNKDGTCDPGESCPGCVDCCTCKNKATKTASTSFGTEIDATVKAPVIGGDIGFKVKVDGSISGSVAGCPECKSTFKESGSLKAEFSLSKAAKFSLGGSGEYDYTKKHCLGCDPATCEQVCLDTYCATEAFNGKVGIGITREVGWELQKTYGPISLEFTCKADFSATLDVTGGYDATKDGGCPPCSSCSKYSAGVQVGGSVTGSCGVAMQIGSFDPVEFGCKECAKVSVAVSGTGTRQSGDCGAKDCVSLKAGVDAEGGSGEKCFSFLWYKVAGNCKTAAGGECVADTCGKDECKAKPFELSCDVKWGHCKEEGGQP